MKDMELGKLTPSDLLSIAGGRLTKRKYMKWAYISVIGLIGWALIVAGVFAIVDDPDEEKAEYRLYEIREHIVVFNQMPTELPTNELKLYNDGDLEYMGVRYAPSSIENNESRDWLAPILLMVIPFLIWVGFYLYLMVRYEREKQDFVDVNCEVTIS